MAELPRCVRPCVATAGCPVCLRVAHPWVVGTLLAMGALLCPWGCTDIGPGSVSEAPWLLISLVLTTASPACLSRQADLFVALQCLAGEAFFYDPPSPGHSPSQPLRPGISCSCYPSSPPRWSVTWVSVQDILIWKRGSSSLTAFLSCASCCNFSCHLWGFSLKTETKPCGKGKNVPHLKWALHKECSPSPSNGWILSLDV